MQSPLAPPQPGAAPDPAPDPSTAETPAERLRRAAEAALASTGVNLDFPEPLKSRYRADTDAPRRAEQRQLVLIGVAIYVIVLTTIILATPRALLNAQVMMIQYSLPLIAAATAYWALGRPAMGHIARETIVLAGSLFVCAITLWAGLAGNPVLLLPRLYNNLLPVILFLIFAGLPFAFSVGLVAVNLAMMLTAVLSHRASLGAATPYPFLVMAAATIPALFAHHRMERAQRRLYLHRLLQSLQIIDLATQNAALADLARRDPLTGCANRRHLDHTLGSIGPRPAHGHHDVLLRLNLDDFRLINQHYGALAGDEILRAAAQTLREALDIDTRPGALLARLEGDNFAVLLPNTSRTEAEHLARAAAGALARLSLPAAPNLHLQVSIGLAQRGPGDDGARLFMLADAALFSAKQTGRNCLRWPPIAA